MFKPLELFIGIRFAKARRKGIMASFISLASFIGIALGVMVLIVGLSAMNGFERELNNRVLSVIPSAELSSAYGNITDAGKLVELLSKEPNIKGAAPVVSTQALISKDNIYRATSLKGIEPAKEEQVTLMYKFITPNALAKLKEGDNIILGARNAKKLHAKIGDTIEVYLTKNTQELGKTSIAQGKIFKVVGLLELSGEIDGLLAFIHLDKARSLLGLDADEATEIAFGVTDNYQVEELSYKAVTHMLNEYQGRFYVKPWTSSYGYLYQDIQMVRTIMYLALIMVVGVACFNIVSSLIMDVNEKRSEIAILLSMGYSRMRVMRTFIVQGALSGALGAMVGALLGYIVASNLTRVIRTLEAIFNFEILNGDIYFIDFVPSEVYVKDVLLVGVIALILSIIASVIPSYVSSRINPAVELSGK